MNQTIETEVVQPSALEAISRAEIDGSIATARKFPQHQPGQLSSVKQSMMTFATLDEETAASCFYTLPRGGKNIQGPSVRLAEIALACYGNCRAGSRIIQTVTTGDSPHVIVQAVVVDLEKNISVSIEKRRRITSKKDFKTGGRKPIDEDDINLATNSCSAIAFRDSVFKVVPLALVKPVFDAARKVAIGDAKTLVTRRADCVEKFAKMGVAKDRIFAKLEIKSVEDITLEHLETLIGMFNAIREGELIEEVFAVESKSAKPADVSDLGPVKPAAGPTGAIQGSPAPTQPASSAQSPESSKETPKAENKPEGQGQPEGPICAYCGKPMEASHLCQGMQEAIAKTEQAKSQSEAATTPAQQEAAEAVERKQLLANIGLVMEKNQVSPEQFKAFLEANKLTKKGQKLSDISMSKIRAINASVQLPQTITEIKKVK